MSNDDLIKKLRKASSAVYLATEYEVAADLSEMLSSSADTIEHLEAENKRLFKMAYLNIPIPRFLQRKKGK